MEYYCVMVLTGEERAFKSRATEALKALDSSAEFWFFERRLYTERRGWFLGALFPGYLFFQVRALTPDFFAALREVKGFCRILRDNQEPVRVEGAALDELKFLIHSGEILDVSKIKFLPGQAIKAVSGPLAGYEGRIVRVNKKKRRVTVRSLLADGGMTFDLKYDEVETSD